TAGAGKIAGAANNASGDHSIAFTGPDPVSAVTVEAWVFPVGGSSYAGLVNYTSNRGLFYRPGTRKLNWYAGADYHSVGSLTAGAWNHIAVTADAANHYAM